MLYSIIEFIKNMEKPIKKVMVNIIKVTFSICILASIVLFLYILDSKYLVTYEVGLILFKTGVVLTTFGFLCSLAFENLRKNV